MEKITKEDYIESILEKYPQTVKFFSEKKLVCIQCGEPVWGTLEDLIKSKYNENNVDLFVKELNNYIRSNQ